MKRQNLIILFILLAIFSFVFYKLKDKVEVKRPIIEKLKQKDKQGINWQTYDSASINEQELFLTGLAEKQYDMIKNEVEERVKRELLAPSQASFSGFSFSISQLKTKEFLAKGSVDAPNTLGVNIRNEYYCQFVFSADHTIRITKCRVN